MIEKIKSYDIFKNHPPLFCEPLAQQGHANTIYLIKTAEKKYLLREFKISIDRKQELRIQQKAYKKGIGSQPVLLDIKKGLMISEFIEGEHKERLSQQELKKMALLLKKLHHIKIRQKRNHFRENFNVNNKKVKQAFVILNKEKKEYALGHNDLHAQNILFTPKGIKLIDWEYARYSDIYFDLVSIIIEYKLNPKDTDSFLRSYLQGKKINHSKLKAFKIIYKELWRLWFEKLAKGEL
jgi:thiamine kinase-like enzyme